MSKNTIKIDGDKLKTLLTKTTGKSLTEIATDNGYSKNIISEACRKGEASPVVQTLVKLYGISPEAYKITEPDPTTEREQISFDDLGGGITQDEITDAIRAAIIELTPSLTTVLTKAIEEAFKKAFTAAIENDCDYLIAEFSRSAKGNTRAAIREALIEFGWTLEKDKVKGGKR